MVGPSRVKAQASAREYQVSRLEFVGLLDIVTKSIAAEAAPTQASESIAAQADPMESGSF
jgi:hypothetical protein